MPIISDAIKLKCLEREIAMRRRVYPSWVRDGRMTQDHADREISTMEAIAQDYREKITQANPTLL